MNERKSWFLEPAFLCPVGLFLLLCSVLMGYFIYEVIPSQEEKVKIAERRSWGQYQCQVVFSKDFDIGCGEIRRARNFQLRGPEQNEPRILYIYKCGQKEWTKVTVIPETQIWGINIPEIKRGGWKEKDNNPVAVYRLERVPDMTMKELRELEQCDFKSDPRQKGDGK